LPGKQFSFPRDHAAHPEFATEWWYYTGHLQNQSGRRFGYQLTWFRQGLGAATQNRTSKWATRDIVFAHFAITDENGQKFYFSDKIARAAAGVAGTSTRTNDKLPVGVDWRLESALSMQKTVRKSRARHSTKRRDDGAHSQLNRYQSAGC
jgi:predicted secreted hydrolase